MKKYMHHRIKYIWDMCDNVNVFISAQSISTLLHIRLTWILKINLGQNQTIRPSRGQGSSIYFKNPQKYNISQKLQWVTRIEDHCFSS